MSILLVFLAVALAAAALTVALAGAALWQGLLLGLGVYLLLHVLCLLFLYAAALTVDRDKPLERQNALCRAGCGVVIGALNAYSGLRPHLSGLEKLPEDRRFLLVCNHRSMFDPCLIIDRLRRWNISFISKPSNLQIPVIGRIAYAAGFLPIDRENDRNALRTILQAADYLKRGVCSMAVYPEGTRSRAGEMLPFHPGCFKIAQRAGAPLVIAAVWGTERVKGNLPLRRTDVYLEILEVLEPERLKAMSTNELAEYSRDLIARRLSETD